MVKNSHHLRHRFAYRSKENDDVEKMAFGKAEFKIWFTVIGLIVDIAFHFIYISIPYFIFKPKELF